MPDTLPELEAEITALARKIEALYTSGRCMEAIEAYGQLRALTHARKRLKAMRQRKALDSKARYQVT